MKINKNLKLVSKKKYHAVSLFSNCGAGDVGYKNAGFTFDVMAELNPIRLNVCLLNHPDAVGVAGDLRNTWIEVVKKYKEKTKNAPLSLLAACPPCQGMSSARGLRGVSSDADAGSKDKRNLLAVIISNVAKELNPKMIVVENVPEFLTKNVRHPETNKPITASNLLIELLSDSYKVFPILLDMCDFQVPQTRKRSFLTFIRHKEPCLKKVLHDCIAPFPKPIGKPILLKDALASFALPSLDAERKDIISNVAGQGLHSVPIINSERYEMVKAIPPNSGLSAWVNNLCPYCSTVNAGETIKCKKCGELLPKPLVKEPNGEFRLISGFKTSYKRMDPSKPSATILTTSAVISSHNTIHPYENRVLSVKECAYLQTFDDDFDWGNTLEKWGTNTIRKMVGEAVPPKFTKMHGDILISLLKGQKCNAISIADKRCSSASRNLSLSIRRNKKIEESNKQDLEL